MNTRIQGGIAMKENKNLFVKASKQEDVNDENVMIWPDDADEEETKELLKGE